MRILEVEISTPNPARAREFYAGVLGFPVTRESDNGFSVAVGNSTLTFRAGEVSGVYHLAFNVPENRFPEAESWARARFPLLTDPEGREIFHSESWNAAMLYFADPDGNILELIARHTLPGSRRDDFTILSISEVGVSSDDVPALAEELGLPPYRKGDDSFRPVGDEEGLFILVRAGRLWFPDGTKPAAVASLAVTFEERGQRRFLPPGPQ